MLSEEITSDRSDYQAEISRLLFKMSQNDNAAETTLTARVGRAALEIHSFDGRKLQPGSGRKWQVHPAKATWSEESRPVYRAAI
ncbi:hypothetical protein [Rhizobium leguminosarum]|uniref:hypothetical protein n=1 Tax=Rhizobium leguminosarum TaxID=384 RepID=UPI001494F5C4|nr:hypothetical protein [Rhizobium leguminosarum]